MPQQRFPKIELLSNYSHEMRFILSETDTSMANALRRIMIAEVPTLAIDLVEFHENSSVLNDEYIAHRLGLIPLLNSIKGTDCYPDFQSHRVCLCDEGCNRCQVKFELDADYDRDIQFKTSSEREANLPITVTSKNLESNNTLVSPAHFVSEEEADESHDEGISIVKLGPGQKLKFTAIARMGIAKEHAKWSPVAVATYRFWPEITLNEEMLSTLTMDQKQELVDCCPDRILELDEITGKVKAAENAADIATFTEDLATTQTAMKKRAEDDDFVRVVQSTDRFIFTIESSGAMDADEILISSLRVLRDKINDLQRDVDKLKD